MIHTWPSRYTMPHTGPSHTLTTFYTSPAGSGRDIDAFYLHGLYHLAYLEVSIFVRTGICPKIKHSVNDRQARNVDFSPVSSSPVRSRTLPLRVPRRRPRTGRLSPATYMAAQRASEYDCSGRRGPPCVGILRRMAVNTRQYRTPAAVLSRAGTRSSPLHRLAPEQHLTSILWKEDSPSIQHA